jgi:hypothetical protein
MSPLDIAEERKYIRQIMKQIQPMSEKIVIPITTVVYCKQQLDAGACESFPEEMQDCLSLIQSGAIKVHIVPPNRTGAKTWNSNREAHVLDYKTSPKNWRHVHSMYLVNQAFLEKIRPALGETLFASTRIDGEMCHYRFGPIVKVSCDPARIEIQPDWEEPGSESYAFAKYETEDGIAIELASCLWNYYDSYRKGMPLQVALCGRQIGSITLLHKDARTKKLHLLPESLLGQYIKTPDLSTWALTFPNHLGETPLHIAARTGEIRDLPPSVLKVEMFFAQDHLDRPVVACIRDPEVLAWAVEFLESRPREEWCNVYWEVVLPHTPREIRIVTYPKTRDPISE